MHKISNLPIKVFATHEIEEAWVRFRSQKIKADTWILSKSFPSDMHESKLSSYICILYEAIYNKISNSQNQKRNTDNLKIHSRFKKSLKKGAKNTKKNKQMKRKTQRTYSVENCCSHKRGNRSSLNANEHKRFLPVVKKVRKWTTKRAKNHKGGVCNEGTVTKPSNTSDGCDWFLALQRSNSDR